MTPSLMFPALLNSRAVRDIQDSAGETAQSVGVELDPSRDFYLLVIIVVAVYVGAGPCMSRRRCGGGRRSEDNLVELALSLYLYVASGTKLSPQACVASAFTCGAILLAP